MPRRASQHHGHAAEYFGRAYHAVYAGVLLPPEQTEAETAFLLKQLKPRRGAAWLDVPCGYGRHLLALRAARPGLRLVGLDLNAEYLRAAGHAGAALLARGDMQALPFAAGRFDVATCLLNSFGYFGTEGDRRVLAEFARVLRPGGRLVLDVANRRALLGIVRRQPWVRYATGDYDVREEFGWDAGAQTLLNRTAWRGPFGSEEGSYRLRLYTPAQLRGLLLRAGLAPECTFGDFRGGPFTADSDRLLIIARR